MSLPFKINKIKLASQTISEQLRSARQDKNLKLENIAKYLKIDYKYLEALEKGNLEKLPVGAYGKNFLREYANFLNLDYKQLTRIFEKERAIIDSKVKEKNYFSKPILKQKLILSIPKLFKNILISAGFIICFFYIGSAVKQIFVPPLLILESPQDNLSTREAVINISGSTEKHTQIIINGETILSNNGVFNESVHLKKGVNIIKITAKKKYGNKTIIERQVILE